MSSLSLPKQVVPGETDVSVGNGKYLLVIGGPLLLGTCGLAIGMFSEAALVGLIREPALIVSDIPFVDQARVWKAGEVARLFRYFFAGIGWVTGLILGLHALIMARSFAAARTPNASILLVCLLTMALTLALGMFCGTLVGNGLTDQYGPGSQGVASRSARPRIEMKILNWRFAPGGKREETVKFCRAFCSIILGMLGILVCSNSFVVMAVGQRARRARRARPPISERTAPSSHEPSRTTEGPPASPPVTPTAPGEPGPPAARP